MARRIIFKSGLKSPQAWAVFLVYSPIVEGGLTTEIQVSEVFDSYSDAMLHREAISKLITLVDSCAIACAMVS